MNHLSKELEGSDIYNRECSIGDAWVTIDNIVIFLQDLDQFGRRVNHLSKELEGSDIYIRECSIGDA